MIGEKREREGEASAEGESKKIKVEPSVRVARYKPGSPKPPPLSSDGYTNFLIHIHDALSPYLLKDGAGSILENIWQFSKVYPSVQAQRQAKHQMRPDDIVWSHPAETHVASQSPLQLTLEYWQWRAKGLRNSYAVRYPAGFKDKSKCIGCLWPARAGDQVATTHEGRDYVLLDYIAARKRIYCALYAELVKTDPAFASLLSLVCQGKKIQLWEVDGPSPTWPEPPFNMLTSEKPGLEMNNMATVKQLLNDKTHSFGHGYTIAALLLHGDEWLKE